MKRCPKCEFIYEDDQSLCDMDGILLVFDSQRLPKSRTSSSYWKNRVFPASAALVLTTVLALVYYVSTQPRRGPSSTYAPASVSESPSTTSLGQPTADPKTMEVSGTASESDNPPVISETSPPAKASKTSTTAPVKSTTNEAKKTKDKVRSTPDEKGGRTNQPDENDSKIESFMKKTGRILKKPFKF